MKIRFLLWLLLCQPINLWAQEIIFGKVVDEENKTPLPGATITVLGTETATSTDESGSFSLSVRTNSDTLQIALIGYVTDTVVIDNTNNELMLIALRKNMEELKGVVVSTGYQNIPKERATGSFTTIDQELLSRHPSASLLDRLEGMAEGLYFDKRDDGAPAMSVRGRGTILSDNRPLIVVDNFPYEGDLEAINPNDVEQITILKDAAAASIWGARAGNGVIVITTKKALSDAEPRIAFNSSVSFNEPPDLYYNPQFLPSSAFVELEQTLFDQGFFETSENAASKVALSPVVELLIQKRDGLITSAEAKNQLDVLKVRDIRKEFERHVYRAGINQQHTLSVKGHTESFNYYVSGGFVRKLATEVGTSDNRITIRSNANSRLTDKLWLGTDINYTKFDRNSGYDLSRQLSEMRPYTRLTDEAGNPLPVYLDYRKQYVDDAHAGGLLNWTYFPLHEMDDIDYTTSSHSFRINTSLVYHFSKEFSAKVLYQYEHQLVNMSQEYKPESYYARNLINRYTQPDGTRAIPEGGILNQSDDELRAYSGRLQFGYNTTGNKNHHLAAQAGVEIRQARTSSHSVRRYGYNSDVLSSVHVDYTSRFSLRPFGSGYIPDATRGLSLFTDRFLSAYLSGSYTYRHRYILSASARRDASNLFGVSTNQKGVPLWSAGFAWLANEEPFFHLPWLSFLKLRGSYGYSGNIDKSTTAYVTALYSTNRLTGLQQATVQSPPNPDLRWEKVRTINVGVDFQTTGNRLSGSLEFYHKKGTDQIGSIEIDPTAGFFKVNNYSVNLNSASFVASGIDLNLRSENIRGDLGWDTQFLLSYNTDRVNDYYYENTGIAGYFNSIPAPVEGKPRMGVYSFEWAGLDPANGDPQVVTNGKISKDYTQLYTESDIQDLYYHGRALPTWHGTILNTFSWKSFSLSANLSFRWNYYFRRSSINYATMLDQWIVHKDYEMRWRHPGDEANTSVPSMPEERNAYRGIIYNNSSILIEKGDHLRVENIRLDYRINIQNPVIKTEMTLFLFWNNPGILWRANNHKIDPSFVNRPYPEPQSLVFGLTMNL